MELCVAIPCKYKCERTLLNEGSLVNNDFPSQCTLFILTRYETSADSRFPGASSVLSTACNPRKIVLSGEVDPRLFGDDSSWMYLYTVRINDYYIADSCQILNHRYRLTADLPEEELYRLLIPDAHAQLYLVLRPGDRLRVNLDSISGQSAYLDIPQSYATTALRSVMFTLHGNGQILSTWSDSLAFCLCLTGL